ncbi:MAG: hypothetical protein IBX55_22285 [Methyloprofundus sp.]|nr:hypothetical protein [Methyloprofundus sp.]
MLVNGGLIFLLALYFLACKNLFSIFYGENQKKVFIAFFSIFMFFFLHIALSLLVGAAFGGIDIVQRDFYEFHRPVLYFLVFAIAFNVFCRYGLISKFERLLFFVFFVFVLIGLNQYLGLYEILSQLYTKQHNINSKRVSAPFVNPYDFAFMMSFFILYFFLKIIYTSWSFILHFAVALIMFILPQSRSVAGTFLVGFFVVLPLVLLLLEFNVKRLVVSKRLLLFCFLILFISIVFFASIPYLLENFRYLTGQFVRLLEGEGIGRSGNIRLEQFLFALDKASNPLIMLFGNGPAKSELEYVESIYNYQFYRYGLLGFLLYFVALIGFGAYFAWKVLKRINRHDATYPFFLALLVWFLIIPLMSVGNNFTEQIRLSFFFYSMLGLLAASYSLTISRSQKVSE